MFRYVKGAVYKYNKGRLFPDPAHMDSNDPLDMGAYRGFGPIGQGGCWQTPI